MNLNKIILSIISIIISIAILEVGLRSYVKKDGGIYELEMMKYAKELKEIKTYKDQKYIKHKPNKNSIKIMNSVISTDKRGYRKNEINVSEELPKIILLGDSMTFGFGSRITFSDILQKKFKKGLWRENSDHDVNSCCKLLKLLKWWQQTSLLSLWQSARSLLDKYQQMEYISYYYDMAVSRQVVNMISLRDSLISRLHLINSLQR